MTDGPPSGGVSGRFLLLTLFGLFALGNVLVPLFLGKAALAAACAVLAGGLLALLWREPIAARVSWRTFGICIFVAFALLLLGGEGRFFYANADWQVRDAVLADLARNPWPFAYLADGGAQLLRAPLGMYLLPALFGRGAEIALLACNTLLLGMMMALGSALLPSDRARRIALAVFLAFSGLDLIGNLLAGAAGSFDHLERWAPGLQYSSVVTLIFWVPQHAFAGWFCALLYLSHRRGAVSLGALAAAIPLAAIWSPLAIIGALPFAALAAARALRAITLRDSAMGALALAMAVPALAYIAADAGQVGSGVNGVAPATWALFLALEVAPFLWILYRLRAPKRFGLDSLILAAAMLALIPFFHIGGNGDFAMRASIAPLAVVMAALIAALAEANWAAHRRFAIVVIAVLSLGAVTGMAEAMRALRYRPSPAPNCTLPEIWTRQTETVADIATYLAQVDKMPAWLRPQAPVLVATRADAVCWAHLWKAAR